MKPRNLIRSRSYLTDDVASSNGDAGCCFEMSTSSVAKEKQKSFMLSTVRTEGVKISQEKAVATDIATWRMKNNVLILLGTLGVIFITLALAIHVADPLEMSIKSKVTFRKGSYIFNMWYKPPASVTLKFYVFNVTNPEAFLAGTEKLRLEEIGPFVYTETIVHSEPIFNDNGTVTYNTSTEVVPEPHLSIMALDKRIVVPNLALLGFSSMLAGSSVFSNLAMSTFSNYLNSQSFLNITIEEFFWGYDDPFIALGSKLAPSWISFTKLGVIDRLLAEGESTETMYTNDEPTANREPFSLDNMNGSPGMKHWGYVTEDNTTHKKCNTLKGVAMDGIIFKRNLTPADSFLVYRKPFCRLIRLVYDRSDISKTGLPTYRMKLPDDVFDNSSPENSCYCQPDKEPCLPRGLSDITPCYYGIPVAISPPHFYNADPRLLEAVDGLAPDKEKHDNGIVIQPDYGMMMEMTFRIQTNLVVKNTKYNKRTAPFNNMTIPLFWLDYTLHELPTYLTTLVYHLLFVLPVMQRAIVCVMASLGVAMVIVAMGSYVMRIRRGKGR